MNAFVPAGLRILIKVSNACLLGGEEAIIPNASIIFIEKLNPPVVRSTRIEKFVCKVETEL
jgi:hypothetical protein